MPSKRANVRLQGEDLATGDLIAARGTLLDARRILLLAAAGIPAAPVVRPVRIALLSTGTELIDPGAAPGAGQTYDINRFVLSALLTSARARITDGGRVGDDTASIAERIRELASNHDLIITSGGVSGSAADVVAAAVAELGGTCERLLVAIKPGKPLLHGRVLGRPILGLPGSPRAAFVDALLFARPLIHRLGGLARGSLRAQARLATDLVRQPGRVEILPVSLERRDDGLWARPVGRSDRSALLAFAGADGFAHVPAAASRLEMGHALDVTPCGDLEGSMQDLLESVR